MGGFLSWMLVLPSISGPFPFTLIRSIAWGGIDPDESNADRLSACPAKLLDLSNQVANDPINLLDHRFRQYLGLRANLDIGDFTSRHQQTRSEERRVGKECR